MKGATNEEPIRHSPETNGAYLCRLTVDVAACLRGR